MKKKTIYIILGVVLGLSLIIFLLSKIPKREFNTFEFPDTLIVENHTSNEHVDTIAMVILNKLLYYDTMEVLFYPLPAIFLESKEIEYVAYLMEDPFEDHIYYIFLLEDCGMNKLKMALCHEFVHLRQHELGYLEVLGETGYVWKGDTARYKDVKYEDRPYEMEAHAEGPILEYKLNQILYKPRR